MKNFSIKKKWSNGHLWRQNYAMRIRLTNITSGGGGGGRGEIGSAAAVEKKKKAHQPQTKTLWMVYSARVKRRNVDALRAWLLRVPYPRRGPTCDKMSPAYLIHRPRRLMIRFSVRVWPHPRLDQIWRCGRDDARFVLTSAAEMQSNTSCVRDQLGRSLILIPMII